MVGSSCSDSEISAFGVSSVRFAFQGGCDLPPLVCSHMGDSSFPFPFLLTIHQTGVSRVTYLKGGRVGAAHGDGISYN